MRSLQLIVPLCLLVSMSGCATPDPRPEDESILEVVESAEARSGLNGCPAGAIRYCLTDVGGRQECTCLSSPQVFGATGGMFGR